MRWFLFAVIAGKRFISTQQRIANLGNLTSRLVDREIPRLLNRNITDELIADDILLRLLPSAYPHLLALSGAHKYRVSMSAMRLLVNKLVLDSCGTKLRIKNVETISSNTGDQSEQSRRSYDYVTGGDKLIVKWETEPAGETDQESHKPVPEWFNDGNHSSRLDHIVKFIEHPGATPLNMKLFNRDSMAYDDEYHRVLSGVFIFEMDNDNTKIQVHTIDNVEMIDYKKKVPTKMKFAC